MGQIEAKLVQKGIQLPTVAAPVANYVSTCIVQNTLYISGQLPIRDGSLVYQGTLGQNILVNDAIDAARLCGLNILAQAKAALGELDRIQRVIKLGGFVASDPLFHDHPKIINGASDLMVEILGDKGIHTRIAVGVMALPMGAPVEIDAILQVS